LRKFATGSIIYLLSFFLLNVWVALGLEYHGFYEIRVLLYSGLAVSLAILFLSAFRNFVLGKTKFTLIDYLILIFFGWEIVSAALASHNFAILPKAFFFNTSLALLAFSFAKHSDFNKNSVKKFANVAAWAVVILAFLEGTILPAHWWSNFGILSPNDAFGFGTLQYVGSIPQVESLFISPNYLAAFLVLMIAIKLFTPHLNPLPQGERKILGINLIWGEGVFFLLFATSALAWTYTRSALIAFILVLLIWIISAKEKRKYALKVSFFLLSLILSLALVRSLSYDTSLSDLFLHGESTAGHTESINKYLTDVSQINPIWGLGPGYSGFVSFDLGQNRLPESSYFQMWQEVGTIGLLLWLLINFLALRRLAHFCTGSTSTKGLVLGWVGISVMAFLLPIWSVPAISIWFWILVALDSKMELP